MDWTHFLLALLAGTAYGLVVGILPAAGATTGLVALFPFIGYFADQPYLGVVFCVAVVASSTTGDTFAGILLGIPGANSAAATMVDGFPLALRGRATFALSAAITASTLNGMLWGALTFLLLPYYTRLMTILGIPELWAFTALAFATVAFMSTRYWGRSLCALALGVFLGLIGYDARAEPRWTFGWDYLLDGIQIMPVVAGLFAIPEIVAATRDREQISSIAVTDFRKQTVQGIAAVVRNWRLALRSGVIGSIIGALPGLGGAVADWLAYSHTVATNPTEEFGNGNIKGVIGCEGANNAQKASSFIPTVLFGIPGAPFAAVLMALFAYLDFELGTPQLAKDALFFRAMGHSFLLSTLITGLLCLAIARYVTLFTRVPYKYYMPILIAVVVYACMQYTQGWEDLAILLLLSVIGFTAKRFKFSRPSILMAYILADRMEKLTWQMTTLYTPLTILCRPIFLCICALAVVVIYAGYRNKSKLDFA